MTPVQRATLDFIEAYMGRNRISPTYQEIADAIGLNSKSNAHTIVRGLAHSGHVKLGRGARKIELPNLCPTCGRPRQ